MASACCWKVAPVIGMRRINHYVIHFLSKFANPWWCCSGLWYREMVHFLGAPFQSSLSLGASPWEETCVKNCCLVMNICWGPKELSWSWSTSQKGNGLKRGPLGPWKDILLPMGLEFFCLLTEGNKWDSGAKKQVHHPLEFPFKDLGLRLPRRWEWPTLPWVGIFHLSLRKAECSSRFGYCNFVTWKLQLSPFHVYKKN